MVQATQGKPNAYWERQIPDSADVCDRLSEILRYITNWEGKTYPLNYGIESITRKPKITASLSLALMDLDKENVPVAVDGSSLYSYVRFSHIRRYPPRDVCSTIAKCERFFSIYLFYPVAANEEGGVAHQLLEAIGNVVDSGFTAWSVKRAFPAMVHRVDPIEVDSSWAGMEVQVCVPYNVGFMDNQDIVDTGQGETFNITSRIDIDRQPQTDVINTQGYFGTETVRVYNGTDRPRDSFIPNKPTSATTETFDNTNQQWTVGFPDTNLPGNATVWASTVTFNKFFTRTPQGEIQFDTQTGRAVFTRTFVSATNPTVIFPE